MFSTIFDVTTPPPPFFQNFRGVVTLVFYISNKKNQSVYMAIDTESTSTNPVSLQIVTSSKDSL